MRGDASRQRVRGVRTGALDSNRVECWAAHPHLHLTPLYSLKLNRILYNKDNSSRGIGQDAQYMIETLQNENGHSKLVPSSYPSAPAAFGSPMRIAKMRQISFIEEIGA